MDKKKWNTNFSTNLHHRIRDSAKVDIPYVEKFFLTHYGDDIMFVENSESIPPKPYHSEGKQF